jgi:hypothetical protein
MADIEQYFIPEEASYLPAAGFPQFINTPGSTISGHATPLSARLGE